MAVKGGPDIETDGLVFHLDAAARNKSYPVDGLDVEYLVVAGGGGAAGTRCGGGGAGGLIHGYEQLTISSGTYPIAVGAGGSRGSNYGVGARGGDSYLSDLVACSGGGGGSYYTTRATSGGSGGGQGHRCCGIVRASGVEGQGNAGGLGEWSYGCGGGGGAGELGGNGKNTSPNRAGKGGDGLPFDIEGYTKYYAGGGAGGAFSFDSFDYSPGGLGGGATSASAGETNTGGGGGGLFYSATGNQGNGGSGIVVIRYKGTRKATGGDSIYYDKGYTVHVFTSSGNFVVGDRVGGTSSNKIVGTLTNMGSSSFKTNNKGYWSFDGSNQYIQIDKTAGQLGISSSGGKFSIDIWFRNTGDGTSSRELFGTFRGYLADIDIYALSNYRFYVSVQDNNGDRAAVTSDNDTCPINQWVYGVLVWDGTTKTISSYLNGQFIGSNTNTLVDNIFEYANDPIKFRIGASSVPNWTYGPPPFEGDIASIKIYDNIALSETQILNNYNATKGRFGL